MIVPDQLLFNKCRELCTCKNAINLYLVLIGVRRSAIIESYTEFDRGGNKIMNLFKQELLDDLYDDDTFFQINSYANYSLSNEAYQFLIDLNNLCHAYGCETYYKSSEIFVTHCKNKSRVKNFILARYHEDTYKKFSNLAYLLEYPIVTEKEYKRMKSFKLYKGNFRFIKIDCLHLNFNYFSKDQLKNTISANKINKAMLGLIIDGRKFDEVVVIDKYDVDLYVSTMANITDSFNSIEINKK